MTDPSTPAGRALLEEFWPERDDEFGLRQTVAHTILAIEAEARAEGRREAAERILERLSLFTDEAHPSITHIRDIVLESVAGLNASEPDSEKQA